MLIQGGADSVIPVVKFSYPIQRALMIDNNKVKLMYPEYEEKHSQGLGPTNHDVGQFYWLKVEPFLRNGKMISENTLPFIIPELEMQDNDNEEDWRTAEAKYTMWKKKYSITMGNNTCI